MNIGISVKQFRTVIAAMSDRKPYIDQTIFEKQMTIILEN